LTGKPSWSWILKANGKVKIKDTTLFKAITFHGDGGMNNSVAGFSFRTIKNYGSLTIVYNKKTEK